MIILFIVGCFLVAFCFWAWETITTPTTPAGQARADQKLKERLARLDASRAARQAAYDTKYDAAQAKYDAEHQ